jgi:hypothetical protein
VPAGAFFYCIFTATAAAVQQTRHIMAATMSGVISISKCIREASVSQSTELDPGSRALG